MNVLVVDDHRLFRDGLLLVLKRIDSISRVLEASDGQEAENLLKVEDIDLALIDFHLPDTTGPTLLRKIKEASPEIPVVIMSGAEDPAMIRSAMNDGSSGFLPKAMEPDELVDAINTVIEGEIYVPPSLLKKVEENQMDVKSAQAFDYADLVHMAQVAQKVISTSDWSIRAKREASTRPESIEAFNQLLAKMENHYQELQGFAFEDSLTGLPNRRLFNDRLEQAILSAKRNGGKLALAALDLDKFKQINDQYGHDQGDVLLKTIAERLEEVTRQVDTVSRLGGDEFTVVITDAGSHEAVTTAVARMYNALIKPLDLDGVTIEPGVSIGVAISDGNVDAKTLFKHADEALYHVKRNGRNGFHIHT